MGKTQEGFIKIVHGLAKNLREVRIPGEANQVLWVIISKTIGFNKVSDPIALSQFQKETGMNKPAICRAIAKLVEMNIIIKKDNDIANEYSVNQDYESWEPLSKKITVLSKKITEKDSEALSKKIKPLSKKIIPIIEKDNKPLSKKIHTKETIKETITKDTSEISNEIPDDKIFVEKNPKPTKGKSLIDNGGEKEKDVAAKKQSKVNGWKVWVDVNRELERADPLAEGKALAAAKKLAEHIKDEDELFNVMKAYLYDDNKFLIDNGHNLAFLPSKIAKYQNDAIALSEAERLEDAEIDAYNNFVDEFIESYKKANGL